MSLEPRSYRLVDVQYDRGAIEPGQPLEVRCVFRKYRGETEVRELSIPIPENLPGQGGLTLVVGNPAQVNRALGDPLLARLSSATDLESIVRVLEDRRASNRLTAVVYRTVNTVVSRGEAFPSLPPSIERLLRTQASSSSRAHGADLAAFAGRAGDGRTRRGRREAQAAHPARGRRKERMTRALMIALAIALCLPGLAATGGSWSASTAKQFSVGTLDGTALDDEGRLRLAPRRDTMWGPEAGVVWEIVADDGDGAFAALSSPGRVLHLNAQGDAEVWFEAEGETLVGALASDGAGGVYAGLSPGGEIVHVTAPGESELVVETGALFVWSLETAADGFALDRYRHARDAAASRDGRRGAHALRVGRRPDALHGSAGGRGRPRRNRRTRAGDPLRRDGPPLRAVRRRRAGDRRPGAR